jgi:hypothetical protein
MEPLASLTYGDGEGLASFLIRHGDKRGEMALYASGGKSLGAIWNSESPSRRRLREDRYVFLYGKYRRVLSADFREGERNLTDTQCLDELANHTARSRTLTLTRPNNRLLQDLPGYLKGLKSGSTSDPRLETLWSRMNAALPKLDGSLSGIRCGSHR